MLNNYDAKRFNRIYAAFGYTDMRKGIYMKLVKREDTAAGGGCIYL